MTNLVITFIGLNAVRLTPTGTISYKIELINSDQTFTEKVASTPISVATDVTLDDGIYKITNITDDVSETILVYKTIVEHLENNIKDILLNANQQTLFPNNYDLVILALISSLILGNTKYQIVAYNVSNLSDYAQIALSFDKVYKYKDKLNNTQQSTTAIL